MADGWNRVDTHGEERPVRAGIDGLQTFGEALCEKSDAADSSRQDTCEGAGTGDPDKDQSVDQERDRPDRHDDQVKEKSSRRRDKASCVEKGKRCGKESTYGCSDDSNADGLKKQIAEPVFLCGEKEAPVRMRESGYHTF